MQKILRSKALSLVGLQAGTAAIIALCFTLGGKQAAVSALLGGLACLVPSLFFACWFFGQSPWVDAKKLLRAFFVGELLKMLTGIIMILIIISMVRIQWSPLIVGYIGTSFGLWLAPLLEQRSECNG